MSILQKPRTEKDIMKCLPDKRTTFDIMVVVKTLSTKSAKSLGNFEVQYVFDPKAKQIVNK